VGATEGRSVDHRENSHAREPVTGQRRAHLAPGSG
jgi:hypothetical protein